MSCTLFVPQKLTWGRTLRHFVPKMSEQPVTLECTMFNEFIGKGVGREEPGTEAKQATYAPGEGITAGRKSSGESFTFG